jgi:outer membrane protein OmpA-like peptidoglycan-associated protein
MTNFLNTESSSEEQWISVSDMMAGLMMIFLFISIIYIQNISKYFSEVADVSDEICADLKKEFDSETERWDMSICENGLLISFDNDSNFKVNSAALSEDFASVLSDFFPRLMAVIYEYQDSISELRIEGHTDSSVRRLDSELTGYLYNTKLSQERSRNVMEYSLNLNEITLQPKYLDWSYTNVTAHGMSSSKRILSDAGNEDYAASRRVEFRLRTKAEDRLLDLVSEIRSGGTD